jgi:phosphate transport system substrate-binding protein
LDFEQTIASRSAPSGTGHLLRLCGRALCSPSASIKTKILTLRLALLFLAATLPVTSFAQETITLVGSGGTSPLPVYNAWAAQYNQRKSGVRMQYLPLDTARSISEIRKGSGDFGGGDTPLTAENAGTVLELPILLMGLVPIYNVPGTQGLRFSGDLLAQIYLGHVKKWNAPQVAQLNPHASLPDMPIKVVYRSPGKGTNYIFTDFLSKANAEFRNKVGRSVSPGWPVGSAVERSADMAQKVMSEPGAVGFVELEYARDNNIPFGEVQNASGKFVRASPETLRAACSGVEAPHWDKFSVSLTNAPGENAYPIASFSWIYLRKTATDQRRRAALLDLLHWMFAQGQEAVPFGYSPLPTALVAKEVAVLDALGKESSR